jgi:putative hydrolase of the HAD superfamily
MLKTKWILFDFGGCLDSDGIHSRVLFFEQFKKHGLLSGPEDLYNFQHAYTWSDKKIMDEGLIQNSNLSAMNRITCSLIAKKLKADEAKAERVAMAVTETQAYYLSRNKKVLTHLQAVYKLGIISNFSGNLEKVLDEFDIHTHFNFVIDSFHMGVEKPNPAIFQLAIEKCQEKPENICFIGDNPERDITPARKLGMKTILISDKVTSTVADYNIVCLEDLLKLT